jgi:hypothetical protein
MRDAIYNLNLKADEIRVNADNENRMIYFKPVPRDLMDMMDLPKGINACRIELEKEVVRS